MLHRNIKQTEEVSFFAPSDASRPRCSGESRHSSGHMQKVLLERWKLLVLLAQTPGTAKKPWFRVAGLHVSVFVPPKYSIQIFTKYKQSKHWAEK